MKKLFVMAMAIASIALISCTGKTGAGDGKDSDSVAQAQNAPAADIQVKTDGTINEKTWTAGETANVSIDQIPQTLADFKALQEKIGKTPEGAVVLQLVAFEMYHQNKQVGEQCIRLCNIDSNIDAVLRRIAEVYGDDAVYARPYLVAAYMDGATPQNGYNPTKPYTFKIRSSQTKQYERSEMMKGYVLYLEVYSSGHEAMPWRSCEVIKQKGSDFYKVSNSPALYAQCQEVPFDADADFKGLK